MVKKLITLTMLCTTSAFCQWGAIVKGDLTSNNGKSKSSIAVLGSINGNNYEVNQNSSVGGLFLVGDNNTDNFIRVLNGDANILGDTGTTYVNNGALLSQSLNLNNVLSEYEAASLRFSIQGEPLDWTGDTNNITVHLQESKRYHIFNIDSSMLQNMSTVNFTNLTSDDLVVFNINQDQVDWKWSVNIDPKNLLINFAGSSFNLTQRHLTGSLITNGDVYHTRDIEGIVVAGNVFSDQGSYIGGTQHTELPQGLNPPPIPEPSSALLTILGIVLFVLVRKR